MIQAVAFITLPKEKIMEIKIIKTGTCPSISGKSTLTYQVGKAGSDIQIRIQKNTGAGRFSALWLSLKAIEQAVGKTPFTSVKLYEFFNGRSINNSAFMLAAMVSEGLAKPSETKKGGYVFDASKYIKPATKRTPKTKL